MWQTSVTTTPNPRSAASTSPWPRPASPDYALAKLTGFPRQPGPAAMSARRRSVRKPGLHAGRGAAGLAIFGVIAVLAYRATALADRRRGASASRPRAGARWRRSSRASRRTSGRRSRVRCARQRERLAWLGTGVRQPGGARVHARGVGVLRSPRPRGSASATGCATARWSSRTGRTSTTRTAPRHAYPLVTDVTAFGARVPDARRELAARVATLRRGRDSARRAAHAHARRRRAHRPLVHAAMSPQGPP